MRIHVTLLITFYAHQLHDNEVAFVEEYCSVMQPLAVALDMLQAKKMLHWIPAAHSGMQIKSP